MAETRIQREANSNSYVAVDVANLSLLAATGKADSFAAPPTPVKKTISRKASQEGRERKAPDSPFAAGSEKLASLVHVAEYGGGETVFHGTTTTARLTAGDGRFRRLGLRRPAPRLDPMRIVIFFATLSSMGTLILLYLTTYTLHRKYSCQPW